MAKGKKCRVCNDTMYADQEKYESQGTWVTYVCRNGQCKSMTGTNGKYPETEKVFEAK